MFGTYMVDHGVYKLTIQNVIKKDFQFQDGSSIVFGGDPYEAALDLKALYTINGNQFQNPFASRCILTSI